MNSKMNNITHKCVMWKNEMLSQCFRNTVLDFCRIVCGRICWSVEEFINLSTFYTYTMFSKYCSRLMSNMEDHMNIGEYTCNVEELT